MDPEIARELTAQRGRELREQAQQAQQAMAAKAVSRRLRAMRRTPAPPDHADDFACPAIPDYVDGCFLADSPAGNQAADLPAGTMDHRTGYDRVDGPSSRLLE